MKAEINQIIDFSNVDGPGNRTAIFFQECPFSCLYCHNPETIHTCISCGICVGACAYGALSMVDGKVLYEKSLCKSCDCCIKACPNLSSPKTKWMDIEEVYSILKRNQPFIRGITVSGGECMMHADYITLLFRRAHELGLTTFIDSNGHYLFSEYPELMGVTDKVMLDVKAYSPMLHKKITGCDNSRVLENLDYLLEKNKLYEVRTVLLPNVDNEETVREVAKRIGDKARYKLIQYRPYGVRREGIEAFGNSILDRRVLEEMEAIALQYVKEVVTV